MTEEPEAKYHWIVMFRKGGRLYPYLWRTIPDMTTIVKSHYERSGVWPHRMWVIVEDEVQKVVITA